MPTRPKTAKKQALRLSKALKSDGPAHVLSIPDEEEGLIHIETGLDHIVEQVGGRDTFIASCRLSSNIKVQNLVERFDSLPPKAQRGASLHDLMLEAGMKTEELVGAVLASVILHQNNVALWISAANRPAVMQASIDTAMLPEGYTDRRMQLQLGGLLPRDGNIINVGVGVNVTAPGIPTFEDDARASTQAVLHATSVQVEPPAPAFVQDYEEIDGRDLSVSMPSVDDLRQEVDD